MSQPIAERLEILAAWHAEQAKTCRDIEKTLRREDRKERYRMMAAHHEQAEAAIRPVVGYCKSMGSAVRAGTDSMSVIAMHAVQLSEIVGP